MAESSAAQADSQTAEPVTGGCACGAVRYTARGPKKFALRCMCRECQRNTGSGHAVVLAMPRDGFTVEGTPSNWTRQSDAGFDITKFFCPTCGCPLYGLPDRGPSFVLLMSGSLDDPAIVQPKRTVYRESGQPWDIVPDEEPAHAQD